MRAAGPRRHAAPRRRGRRRCWPELARTRPARPGHSTVEGAPKPAKVAKVAVAAPTGRPTKERGALPALRSWGRSTPGQARPAGPMRGRRSAAPPGRGRPPPGGPSRWPAERLGPRRPTLGRPVDSTKGLKAPRAQKARPRGGSTKAPPRAARPTRARVPPELPSHHRQARAARAREAPPARPMTGLVRRPEARMARASPTSARLQASTGQEVSPSSGPARKQPAPGPARPSPTPPAVREPRQPGAVPNPARPEAAKRRRATRARPTRKTRAEPPWSAPGLPAGPAREAPTSRPHPRSGSQARRDERAARTSCACGGGGSSDRGCRRRGRPPRGR